MSHRWRWSWFGAKSDATVEVLAEAASLLALAASPFPGWAFSLSLSLASWLFSCSALGMQTTCAPPPFTASMHLEVHSDTQCPILKVNPVKPIDHIWSLRPLNYRRDQIVALHNPLHALLLESLYLSLQVSFCCEILTDFRHNAKTRVNIRIAICQ